MKLNKIIFIVLGSLITIVVAAMVYILVIIDPNDYKPEIVEQVKLNSGGNLVIEGDISWRFLPNIGLTLGHTRINNPEGFPSEPIIEFQKAQVDLAFWPLLSKKIEVGLISIQGLAVNLHTRKDGVNNLDAMTESAQKTDEVKDDGSETSGQAAINDLVIDGIQVVDANIVIKNLAAKTEQSIESINFELGKLVLEEPVPLSFSTKINTGDISAEIQSNGHIKIAKDLQRFDFIKLVTNVVAKGETLPNKKIEINNQITGYFDAAKQFASVNPLTISLLGIDINGKLSAKLAAIPSIEYEIKLGDIDLDAILPESAEETEQPSQQPIDLSWMKSFNIKGLVTVDSLKASNLTLSNISVPMELKAAQLKLSAIKAQLYQGNMLANVTLDGRRSVPGYSLNTTISDVQALPLVKDLMEKELVSGTANISIDIKGKGLDDKSIRKNSKGNGKFTFTDGAIHGVNVAQLIRSAYAKLKGQTIEESDEPAQTDFASFTGSFTLAEGIVNNSDLNMISPLLRISGQGSADIVKETVNYNLKTAVVGSLEGQGGEPITDLKSVTIPLTIKGPMADPSISLNMKEIFKEEAKEKLKDKLKDKLKGLFGR